MQPAIRDYYHLEELWGEKPVKMKIASAAPRLVKAASHGDGDGKKPAARGAVRRVVPAERPASVATPAKRAPAKRVVIRTTGVKSTAAKAARTGPRPAVKKAAAKR